ncbi:MAG: alpha/beta fold hydrolase [Rhodospirillaceae bacterium]|jgi:pimeloyl-ACP methyl ester carboxylesterase|nr:alpha/beta fold hydrolase [Rhodospirillaceae bacterium]MBT5944382.1 alpha/beta fold hydrolase [Rhodospirillaceae bacterium]MBT6404729.1 alpha/beta fold hydrolase [Rhodospirillaceae bacterium]MBT6536342.1 alpha/beta fold hydrolase [Rhodospirillaceae bacterium]MBT7360664.1 alpha/beta fold hydrolase [Rhodospirillaceae bacterium]
MSIYVLVHGAFHGGWCYEKVVPLLEAAGHTAIAVDLPGHGDNRVPMEEVTLDAYVDHVCGVISAQTEPVILVGHSLGGLTITQVAERLSDKVAWVVYLTAVMPANGQSRADLAKIEGDNAVASNRILSEDQLSATMPDAVIKPTFYGECSDEDVVRAKERLVPQAVQIFQQPVRTSPESFGSVKRAFIECLRDQAIKIEMQRKMIELLPCDRVFTIDTDHSPFYSAPDELARDLLELA